MNQQLTIFNAFSNTTRLSGRKLLEAVDNAESQREKVLAIFRGFPKSHIAPHELMPYFKEWPITSIRRCLTYLTKDDLLIKSSRVEKRGQYQMQVHTWRLNTDHEENRAIHYK